MAYCLGLQTKVMDSLRESSKGGKVAHFKKIFLKRNCHVAFAKAEEEAPMLSQEESAEDVRMMRTAEQDVLRTVLNLSSRDSLAAPASQRAWLQ